MPDQQGLLAGIIKTFPKYDQILLSLIWVEGCTIQEAALVLHKPEAMITSRAAFLSARARRILKRCVEA